MANERHFLSDTMKSEATSFEELWRWPEDGPEIALLQNVVCDPDNAVPKDVWQSDSTASYPWTGDPTVGQLLSWSYAQLAMLSTILKRGDYKFQSEDYFFRRSFYQRMYNGRISPTSLVKDEKERLTRRSACVYCGCSDRLSLDHLLPRSKGGPDEGFNLVLACLSCNSSKRNMDLLVWHHEKGEIPPLHLLRRYLKLVIKSSKEKRLWDSVVTDVSPDVLPFDFQYLPPAFPDLRILLKKEEAYNAIFSPAKPVEEPEVEQLMLGFDQS